MESDFRANLSAPGALHSFNQARAAVRGSLGERLAYDLNLGLSFDKVDPEAFAPYAFTKQWDGYHIWAEDGSVSASDGVAPQPSIGFSSLPELSLDLWDSRINLQLSRLRRQWGVGEGSLSLSGTARPIEAFAGSIQPGARWKFHFLDGTLGDWWNAEAEQKMLSIHRLEWYPWDWLYLSPWESVVYAKRLELSYLNPLRSYFMGQHINGDLDNIAFGGEAAVTIRPYFRLYFSLFLDEIVLVPLSRLFTRPNNQFAWQAGLKVPIPWLPFALLTLQYTKIEPYCYTHYPYHTQSININYSHDGENLGYHLPPNSDELLLRLFTHPADGPGAHRPVPAHPPRRREITPWEKSRGTSTSGSTTATWPSTRRRTSCTTAPTSGSTSSPSAVGYRFAGAPLKALGGVQLRARGQLRQHQRQHRREEPGRAGIGLVAGRAPAGAGGGRMRGGHGLSTRGWSAGSFPGIPGCCRP